MRMIPEPLSLTPPVSVGACWVPQMCVIQSICPRPMQQETRCSLAAHIPTYQLRHTGFAARLMQLGFGWSSADTESRLKNNQTQHEVTLYIAVNQLLQASYKPHMTTTHCRCLQRLPQQLSCAMFSGHHNQQQQPQTATTTIKIVQKYTEPMSWTQEIGCHTVRATIPTPQAATSHPQQL